MEEHYTSDAERNVEYPEETEAVSDPGAEQLPKKRSRVAQVLAIIGLCVMAFLIGWLIFCVATGSQYTVAVLFVTILYPVILYLFFWLKKVFSKK